MKKGIYHWFCGEREVDKKPKEPRIVSMFGYLWWVGVIYVLFC